MPVNYIWILFLTIYFAVFGGTSLRDFRKVQTFPTDFIDQVNVLHFVVVNGFGCFLLYRIVLGDLRYIFPVLAWILSLGYAFKSGGNDE